MGKHWEIRSLLICFVVGVLITALAAALAWVMFVPAADWLAHHDVGSAQGQVLATARDAARGRLLTLGAGLIAAGALLFTARNFTISRRTYELTEQAQRRTHELTEQGQVTDRYTKAIEQIGSDKMDVRIGGIYALERIARDSIRDHPPIIEVLSTFIREHSHEAQNEPDPASYVLVPSLPATTRADIQAAITVIARRDYSRDTQPIDLHGVDLHSAVLVGGHFAWTNFEGANLSAAALSGANLAGAVLQMAQLRGANLRNAKLHQPFNTAKFPYFYGSSDVTNLRYMDLSGADISDADFRGANCEGIKLVDAKVERANFTQATWSPTAYIPDGWSAVPVVDYDGIIYRLMPQT